MALYIGPGKNWSRKTPWSLSESPMREIYPVTSFFSRVICRNSPSFKKLYMPDISSAACGTTAFAAVSCSPALPCPRLESPSWAWQQSAAKAAKMVTSRNLSNSLPQKHKVSHIGNKDIIVLPSWKLILNAPRAKTVQIKQLPILNVACNCWLSPSHGYGSSCVAIQLIHFSRRLPRPGPPHALVNTGGRSGASSCFLDDFPPVNSGAYSARLLLCMRLHLAWINQPQVLPDEPRTHAVLHYEVSEYCRPVNTNARPQARAVASAKSGPGTCAAGNCDDQ